MAGEELAALGLELRGRADAWLAGLLDGWTLPGAEAAAEPLAELSLLERDVAALAGQVATLEALRSALTAGFPGAPAPVLADAPADEDIDPDAVRDARARPPAPQEVRSGADDRAERRGGEGGSEPPPPHGTSGTERRSADREVDVASPPPSSARGIRGLGDLAALAGSDGLDLDAGRAESAPPADRGGQDGGWDDASPSDARPDPTRGGDRWAEVDPPPMRIDRAREDSRPDRPASGAEPTSLAPQPIRLPTWDLADRTMAADQDRQQDTAPPPADAGTESGGRARGDLARPDASVSRGDAPSAAPPPIRLPTRARRNAEAAADADRARDIDPAFDPRGESGNSATAQGRWSDLPPSMANPARGGGLTLALLEPRRIALPFLDPPVQPAEDAVVEDNRSVDRGFAGRPIASRESAPGRAGDAQPHARGDARSPLPSIGRRIVPAAEILGALGETARSVDVARLAEGVEEPAQESAGRLAREPGGIDPPARVAGEETVAIVREVDAGGRGLLAEPPGWPDLDVQDLMDALAREIAHEYRRHYGGA
jgi:hypothetical protein